MDVTCWMEAYWKAVADQDAAALAAFFAPDAAVQWHNTNERFTVAEFLRANCEYPGGWAGAVERVEEAEGRLISAARVWTRDGSASFHAVSFFTLEDGKIKALDEYWGDDGPPPQWRRDLGIGTPIHAKP